MRYRRRFLYQKEKAEKDMTFNEIEQMFNGIYGPNSPERLNEFQNWMSGQTGGINEYGEIVIYAEDINRFLNGLSVID